MKRHALTLLGQHALSTLSAMWVIGNLLVWLSLLIVTLPALLVLKPLGREGASAGAVDWVDLSVCGADRQFLDATGGGYSTRGKG